MKLDFFTLVFNEFSRFFSDHNLDGQNFAAGKSRSEVDTLPSSCHILQAWIRSVRRFGGNCWHSRVRRKYSGIKGFDLLIMFYRLYHWFRQPLLYFNLRLKTVLATDPIMYYTYSNTLLHYEQQYRATPNLLKRGTSSFCNTHGPFTLHPVRTDLTAKHVRST